MSTEAGEPPLGGTTDHILALLPSMVPSAQRIARICVERPGDVVNMSGADLAAEAGASPASVSRMCQALGFRSFLHLRLLLGRDLGHEARDAAPEGTSTAGQLKALGKEVGNVLERALESVDIVSFDAAVAYLSSAPRLLLIGAGASQAVAQSAAVGFLTIGRACEAPADAVVQQLSASLLNAGDVCLAISGSGENPVTLAAVRAAVSAGATVIGVSSFARAPLAEIADVMLVGGARLQEWDGGVLSGGIVHNLLLGALRRAVAERMRDTAEWARSVVRQELVDLVGDGGVVDSQESPPTVS